MKRFTNWPWLHWAKYCPSTTAIIIEQQPISWLQLSYVIQSIANQMAQQGIQAGQSIALRGKNSEVLLLNYLATMQLGCRVLLLSPKLPDVQLAKLLPTLSIDFGWSEDPFFWPSSIKSITISVGSKKRLNINSTPYIDSIWRPQQPVTMTLTSGSTGLPKAIVHNADNHLMNADGLLQLMQFEQQDSWLLSLPLFHVSGQSIVWRWLYRGAIIVLRTQSSLVDALQGCTHASLVPTQLWRLLNSPHSDLKLKQVLLGGAAIPVELIQQAQQVGISCWCGYGMTEMASTVCAKAADNLPGVGLPLPHRQLCLVNEEILLRGDCLSMGYWQNNAIIPLTDSEGWFHTRDRGVMRNGELCVIGRLDNIFFSGGEAIQPEEIESILITHPLIEQAFILPKHDVEYGQRPVAVIQYKIEVTPEEMHKWLAGKIARYQYPVAWYKMPEELTQSGIKVSRNALSQWLAKMLIVTT